MKEYVSLLRQGSKSAALAAVVNLVIALVKGGAFLLTGNVAMFAETMHSFGDAANQLFVYVGSAKKPLRSGSREDSAGLSTWCCLEQY